MAKKKVTKKKTRPTARATRAPAAKKSKKKKTAMIRKSKTARKPAAGVAKKSSKKKKKTTAKVTRKPVKKKTSKATTAPATISRKKKPSTAARTDAVSRKTTPTKTSKGTSRARSRGVVVRPSPDANGYVIINGRRVRMMSVAAEVPSSPVRKKRSRKPDPKPEPAGKSRKAAVIKTKLGRKDLDNYRTQLLIRRAELVGDLSAMEAQALRSSGGNPSHMPIHMADVGTDTFDQDFMLGMAETERQRLREIDAALKRIEDKTYGICEMTQKVIPKSRLNAKPWARYTIESAREVERGLGE